MRKIALLGLFALTIALPALACEDEYILPPETIARCFFPTAKIPDDIWKVSTYHHQPRSNLEAEADDYHVLTMEIGESRAGRLEYSFNVIKKEDFVIVEFLSSQKIPGMKPLPVNSNCSLKKWTPLPQR